MNEPVTAAAAAPGASSAKLPPQHAPLLLLTVGAIGVVFGDIGTSPLYTLKEIFNPAHHIEPTPVNVLGALSLIFWALILMVTLKYVVLLLRADNNGEGGIMALVSLALRTTQSPRRQWLLMTLAMFGLALFYGDSMITPAISVLSAIEGLEIAAPLLHPYVIPLTLLVLTALFYLQSRGTGRVATFFGPITCVWFVCLALLGIYHIAREPHVLYALSPHYAFGFFLHHGWVGIVILGAVVLAITGGEALYADMGHFGKRAIRLAWFSLVLPALLLNYFGQGALLLRNNQAVDNPFYLMLPDWLQLPMVGLATAATIIASQAVISGAFSLTRQAIQLDYCPRLQVIYTSAKNRGQIYMPFVNWTLFAAVVALVLFFQSSSGLASAYGLAVTATMLIDTILVLVVAYGLWHWPQPALITLLLLALIDGAFLIATSLKIFDGGWFPLLIGITVYTLFSTWRRGREHLRKRRREEAIEIDVLLDSMVRGVAQRIPGTAVFFTGTPQLLPRSLLHNLKHNKVLHERVVLLTLQVLDVPRVKLSRRVQTEALQHGFYRVIVSYGFKDRMHIPLALRRCASVGLPFQPLATSYFFSRDTVIVERSGPFARWRQHLFATMLRLSLGPNSYLNIPNNQVLELGAQIRL